MLKKIYKVYCVAECIIAGIGFFAIVMLTLMNAILRTTVSMPIIFADDLSLLLFSWVAFLGADVALRHCRLVGMDILTSKLPEKIQKVLQLVVYIIIIGALIMFAKFGYELAMGNWARNYNSLPISYGWATLSLPVCSVLMVLTAVIKVVKLLRHFGNDDYRLKQDVEDPVIEPEEPELVEFTR